MTSETCCTSMPRPKTSVVMRTRVAPLRNSATTASRSFCGWSPCRLETVKCDSRILAVSHSTLARLLQKMTACTIVSES